MRKQRMSDLDRTSTDALHWAEQFLATVESVGKSAGDINADWLHGWFANYWAAVHDPLYFEIGQLQQQNAALRKAVRTVVSVKCGPPLVVSGKARYYGIKEEYIDTLATLLQESEDG
jgi:hypothetical protein